MRNPLQTFEYLGPYLPCYRPKYDEVAKETKIPANG
jgi:hypothetical protein